MVLNSLTQFTPVMLMEVCETEITTYRLVGQSVIVIEVPRRSLCVYDMASVCFQLSS